MKDATLNIRIEPLTKNTLEELAHQADTSMADFVAYLINNYSTSQEALQKVKYLETEVNRLKIVASSFDVTRFQELFNELRGKNIKQKSINTQKDLLQALTENFKYDQKEEEVIITSDLTVVTNASTKQHIDVLPTQESFNWPQKIFHVLAAVIVMFAIAFAWRVISNAKQ